MSATSVDVPPTSSVRIFLIPAFLPTQSAPVTPPAGPDIKMSTGCSCAFCADINPPSDRNNDNLPVKPASANLLRRLEIYLPTTGRTAAFATVVSVRSYSCISGRTSWLSDTGTFGIISRARSPTCCSCAPFVYAFIKLTVIASTPCSFR